MVGNQGRTSRQGPAQANEWGPNVMAMARRGPLPSSRLGENGYYACMCERWLWPLYKGRIRVGQEWTPGTNVQTRLFRTVQLPKLQTSFYFPLFIITNNHIKSCQFCHQNSPNHSAYIEPLYASNAVLGEKESVSLLTEARS